MSVQQTLTGPSLGRLTVNPRALSDDLDVRHTPLPALLADEDHRQALAERLNAVRHAVHDRDHEATRVAVCETCDAPLTRGTEAIWFGHKYRCPERAEHLPAGGGVNGRSYYRGPDAVVPDAVEPFISDTGLGNPPDPTP